VIHHLRLGEPHWLSSRQRTMESNGARDDKCHEKDMTFVVGENLWRCKGAEAQSQELEIIGDAVHPMFDEARAKVDNQAEF
jgi:hypothetical protein